MNCFLLAKVIINIFTAMEGSSFLKKLSFSLRRHYSRISRLYRTEMTSSFVD